VIILAVDPGGTTGYAIGEVNEGFRFVAAGESKLTESGLFGLCESISPLYVVAESFEFRQSKSRIVLDSRDLLGVLKLWATLRHRSYHTQSASTGKSYFDDDKLRKEGVYTVGSAHARDATRHLLHWITFREGYQFYPKDGKFID
jgi:hypothetical protein